jgi:iron complex outermembrane receptor protein
MGENGDALLGINVQHQTSDGYRTFSNVWANNAMLKFKKAVGDSSLLTANLNFQQSNYYLNDKEKGLTNDQADRLGKNFNLGDNPLKANYYGYNRVEKSTNMTYVALQTDWGKGWATDNKTYYYNYTNNGLTTIATNMETGLGTVKNSAGGNITNQMPGGLKTNEYDVWGNIAKLTKETSTGLARVGMWGEVANTNRTYYDLNLLGNTITPNYDQAAVPGVLGPNNNVLYNQKSGWHQYQPFAEYEWQVNPDLKVTPGFKYMHTRLSMDALVNQTGRTNVNYDKTFAAKLPYLTANYTIAPGLSTYAQYAQGMLVPDIGNYQSTSGSLTNIDPQKSTNYQLGLVHQSDRLTVDTDIYYIKFTNKIAQTPGTTSSAATYYNQGGVAYKGVEGQLTYALTDAVSGYVNGSLNRATSYSTGLETKDVPNSTSALGLLYRSGGWSATVFYKRVGRTYALDDQGYEIAPYSTTDLNISYLFKKPGMGFKTFKAQLGIFNLQDKQSVIAVSPTNKTAGAANYGTYAAADTFFWQPPRSMMMSLKADF